MGTTNAYNETYTYDANGNIKTLDRYDGAATPAKIDGLTYGYNLDGNGKLINNRLRHVKDTRSSSLCDYDIDDQNDDNYLYDAIGNLTKDNAEEIDNIEWNAYGKISKITRATGSQKSNLEFIYDAMGNRVCKIEKPYNLTSTGWKYTFYVRDASGNIMTTYTKTGSEIENNVLKLDEVMLYGSSRIGTREVNALLPGLAVPTTTFSRSLGLKRYEVSNHLGNVLTTFTDRKKQVQSGSSVTGYETYIASSQDYYPFGMIMNERNWNTSGYRFGFNGKEMDNEVSGDGNQYDYGFRIYNPRIGKFLSMDPLFKSYPWNSTYAFAENDVIRSVDLEGLEKFIVIGKQYSDGSYKGVRIELQNCGDLGDGVLTVYQRANGSIRVDYLPSSGVEANRERSAFGRMWKKFTSWLSREPSGGTRFTSEIGQNQETRKGDGNNVSADIDYLLAIAGTSRSLGSGPLSLEKVAGRFTTKILKLAKNLGTLEQVESSGEDLANTPKNIKKELRKDNDSESQNSNDQNSDSGTIVKKDSVDIPVMDGVTGDTIGAFRTKRGDPSQNGRFIKKSEVVDSQKLENIK